MCKLIRSSVSVRVKVCCRWQVVLKCVRNIHNQFNLSIYSFMRKITLIMMAFMVSMLTMAQNLTVQGIPRSEVPAKKKVPFKEPNESIRPDINFDSICYYVGSGRNRSALVVKWDDGKGNNTNLVWGYKWNSSSDPGLPHCRQILYHLSHQESPIKPWESPGKNTGIESHFLVWGIFLPSNRILVSYIASRFFTTVQPREA